MLKIFFVLLVLAIQKEVSLASPIIRLPNGLIRGREVVTLRNKTYYAFEQIPYARAPVGPLRFKAPLPAQNWDGILDATKLNVSCHQGLSLFEGPESEDCLFVNVYTPRLPPCNNDDLLPVMFYIYGGGFLIGSSVWYRPDRFVEKDVIVITMNYRLGIFGFLSTQDTVIPGNSGLKDQLLALKWTKQNAKLFGGDPERITIFGHSSGAASAAYLMSSHESQDLFRGAILQSGSFLCPWAYQREARKVAFDTAAYLNESVSRSNDSKVLLNFLQKVSTEELMSAAARYRNDTMNPESQPLFQGLFWAPVIEVENPGAVVTERMYNLLKSGNVLPVPVMMGITSEESLSIEPADKDYLLTHLNAYDKHLSWIVPDNMQVTDEGRRKEIGREIRDIYTNGEPFLDHLGDGMRLFSDNSFTRSMIKHAELHKKIAKTYFYQFSYDGLLGNITLHYEGANYVGHGEELEYMWCFTDNCNINSYPESDWIMSERLVTMWTNFAKYLNPTPEASILLQNIIWPEVNRHLLYLDINKNLEVKSHPKKETYTKWIKIYNSLGHDDFDTY